MVEIAQYEIAKKIDDVEIRKYPSCIMATTKLPVNDRNSAFRRVAGYIFGGNSQSKQIAMTAPVVMSHAETTFTMSFIMPKEYAISDLPTPQNKDVVIKKVPKRTLAVLKYSGLMSQDRISQKIDILLQILKDKRIKVKGKPFFMGYNAPWTLPFLRRNEVAVEV